MARRVAARLGAGGNTALSGSQLRSAIGSDKTSGALESQDARI